MMRDIFKDIDEEIRIYFNYVNKTLFLFGETAKANQCVGQIKTNR